MDNYVNRSGHGRGARGQLFNWKFPERRAAGALRSSPPCTLTPSQRPRRHSSSTSVSLYWSLGVFGRSDKALLVFCKYYVFFIVFFFFLIFLLADETDGRLTEISFSRITSLCSRFTASLWSRGEISASLIRGLRPECVRSAGSSDIVFHYNR